MRKIFLFSLIYIYTPIILFLLTWLNPLYGFFFTTICIIAVVLGYQSWLKYIEEKELILKKSILNIAIIIFVFIVLGVFCGGGTPFFPQDYDWSKHSAILNDLTHYEWPVVYKNESLLTYYLGQYLVPGFIGKIFGSLDVARWMQVIWNALGYTLIYYLLLVLTKANNKKRELVVLIIMIFFCGATNLGFYIYRLFGNEAIFNSYKWIDMEMFKVHFASNFDSMRGAFQHIVVPWMASALFLLNPDHVETYALIALPVFFSATFGFVYFAIILIAYIVVKTYKVKTEIFRQIFSVANVLIFCVSIVFLVYLMGNIGSEKPNSVGFFVINLFENIEFYIIFIMVEFGVYFMCLYKRYYRTPIYWIIMLELVIIPFFGLGLFNDLCSRGSIPARFILMTFLIEHFWEFNKKKLANTVALVFLIIGMLNVFSQGKEIFDKALQCKFNPSINMRKDFTTLEGMAANPEIRVDEAYNYFTIKYNECLFYRIADHNE